MIYWHVERNSVCIYSQLKSCSASEVAAMIEGVLRHCTTAEIDRDYVNTHGASVVGFAFAHLLGFRLLPRLCGRPMHLSPRAAEEWLREEVGKLLTDSAVTQIEVTTLGSASLRWGRQWDYLIAIDLRAGSDAGVLVDGAACAALLGDFRLLGTRPSVVVADERPVVLAERRA